MNDPATFCEYQVTGKRNYRGHTPGTIFQARHDPAKQRGIFRGDITMLRICEPAVPQEHEFPDGWLPPPKRVAPRPTNDAPKGASSIEGG